MFTRPRSRDAHDGMVEAARLLALGQGAVWFVLLSHGGSGLVVGPLAWIAVLIGRGLPAAAAGRLLVPVIRISEGWAEVLLEGPSLMEMMFVAVLVGPAIVAISIFLGQALGSRVSGARSAARRRTG